MRILIVTHVVARNDGQGRVNYEIVQSALARGCTVTLLASHVDADLAAHPRVRWEHIVRSRLPTRLLQYQAFALKSGWWIRRHRDEFDIVHLNGFIAWARADVNTVHFVHSGWYRCGFYPFSLTGGLYDAYQVVFTRLNAWLERIAFAQARAIVPVSYKVAAEVRAPGVARGRASGQNLQVIHNGVDTGEFRPGVADRAAFGLPPGPFMLLFAGDLRVPRKNLDTVLRALARISARERDGTHAPVHLAVAGALSRSVYPELARQLGIADRVHFLDMVKDMPGLMRSVDAFVFPSRYEAMSLVLLEAMASGLPVVTAVTAGGAEVIAPDCGIVLDNPDDDATLARVITELEADRARVAAIGAAARIRALALTSDEMGRRYVDLYRSLVADRAHRAAPSISI